MPRLASLSCSLVLVLTGPTLVRSQGTTTDALRAELEACTEAAHAGDLDTAGASLAAALSLTGSGTAEPIASAGLLHETGVAWSRAAGTNHAFVALAHRVLEACLALREEHEAGTLALIETLDALGVAQQRARASEEAVHTLERALEERERLAPDSPDLADALQRLGLAHRAAGDPEAARASFERALAHCDRLAPEHPAVASLHDNLADLAHARGEFDAMERHLDIAEPLHHADDTEAALNLVRHLRQRADLADARGQRNAIGSLLQRALELVSEHGPGTGNHVDILNDLGIAATRAGFLPVAVSRWREALEIQERIGPSEPAHVTIVMNIALSEQFQGRTGAARRGLERALRLAERGAPGSDEHARVLNNLGIVVNLQGDLNAGRLYQEKSLAMLEARAPDSLDAARALANLGSTAGTQGDYEAARGYLERATAIFAEKAPESPDRPLALVALGNALMETAPEAAQGVYEEALALQERLAPRSPQAAAVLHAMGLLASERGDHDAARRHFERALERTNRSAPDSLDAAETIMALGNLALTEDDLEGARERFEEALAIRTSHAPDSLAIAQSHGALARIHVRTGDLEKAESHLVTAWSLARHQAGSVLGDEARQAFGSSQASLAAQLARVQLGLGKPVDAFRTVEEGRAQSLLTLMAERGESLAGVDPQAWAALNMAKMGVQMSGQRVAQLGAQAAALERDIAPLEEGGASAEELTAKRAELQRVRAATEQARSMHAGARAEVQRRLAVVRSHVPGLEPEAASLDDIRGALPANSVLVSYQLASPTGIGIVVSADPDVPVQPFEIEASSERLAGLVGDLRDHLARSAGLARGVVGIARRPPLPKRDRELEAVSRELYGLLFPGIADELLRRAERVVLSPDGALWELPFAALVTKPRGRPEWLGLTRPISYTQSGSVLAREQRAQRAGGGPPLVLGDALFERSPDGPTPNTDGATRGAWARLLGSTEPPAPLPATRAEAIAIARLHGVDPLLGGAATEAAVRERLADASLVHLATHGYFHPWMPMQSGLLLAPPEQETEDPEPREDGALQAWELLGGVELQAELVVLSACETGRGRAIQGEGLVGLTRAFQAAGARSVVATHWPVADSASAALMTSFHERLRSGARKDDALRAAMVEASRRSGSHHPYHWSGFFLSGDAAPLMGLEASRLDPGPRQEPDVRP